MTNNGNKKFLISDDQIQPLAEGHGACFATDAITVKGDRIGFMYREEPDNEYDSGWRFLSGNESQEYLDDDRNTSVVDVNMIANYAPEIIPYLDSEIGSAFEREEGVEEFEEIELIPDDEDE